MKILVTGSTGLVGSALINFLETNGNQVLRLVRHTPRNAATEIEWYPEQGRVTNQNAFEGFDAAIHLAGESVAEGRWTPEKKARIRESRVHGTTLLAETLAKLERPPRVLASASAIGFYGNRGDEVLTEESAPGKGFLAGVCREWEAATAAAEKAGIRVVHLRFGIVLSSQGGALAKLLTPFKLGAGGKIGNGKQWMSWIAIDDAIAAIHKVISADDMNGAVNLVAPNPVTNAELTETLGRVLGRPTLLGVPAFAARIAFGEMADAMLLSSARVQPQKLLESGYVFEHTQLEGALRHILKK